MYACMYVVIVVVVLTNNNNLCVLSTKMSMHKGIALKVLVLYLNSINNINVNT